MKSYLKNILNRSQITANSDVVRWWNKGRLFLNMILLVVTIAHILILVLVFKNGWFFFLLPFIILVWVGVNLLFSVGLIFELVAKKTFKPGIDFNKLSPSIKLAELVMLTVMIIFISIWHLSRQ